MNVRWATKVVRSTGKLTYTKWHALHPNIEIIGVNGRRSGYTLCSRIVSPVNGWLSCYETTDKVEVECKVYARVLAKNEGDAA